MYQDNRPLPSSSTLYSQATLPYIGRESFVAASPPPFPTPFPALGPRPTTFSPPRFPTPLHQQFPHSFPEFPSYNQLDTTHSPHNADQFGHPDESSPWQDSATSPATSGMSNEYPWRGGNYTTHGYGDGRLSN
jgi:hypothetical protein